MYVHGSVRRPVHIYLPTSARTARRSTQSHNYIGHNYIGHNYIGHNYIGHNYIGHNYIGHNYMGHSTSVRTARRSTGASCAPPTPTFTHMSMHMSVCMCIRMCTRMSKHVSSRGQVGPLSYVCVHGGMPISDEVRPCTCVRACEAVRRLYEPVYPDLYGPVGPKSAYTGVLSPSAPIRLYLWLVLPGLCGL